MPWNERLCVINNLSMVDEVYTFDDEDGSAKAFIRQVRAHYPDSKLIFANGGDRTKENIPEMDVEDPNIEFVFGVGGEDKKNSSSWILNEWKNPKAERPWGHWRVLYDIPGCKVKELVVEPGQKLSMQRHKDRAERWFVAEGTATVYWEYGRAQITKHNTETIQEFEWHQLANETDAPLHIVEIQYGARCDESDIQRR